MTKQLYIACAGAGKTQLIVKDAIEMTNNGHKVLVVTYTENNQKELRNRFIELGGKRVDLFIVKGWYSFLLEEVIRPYQNCIFEERVNGINFNASHPHKINGITIKDRAEKNLEGNYNPKYFFDKKDNAYREFLAKLACNILKISKIKIYNRLEAIYKKIYFDEVQDLAGWDFDLLKYISRSKTLEIVAVGDFRQTLYHTVSSPKKPSTQTEKLNCFQKMGFVRNDLNESKRSILTICNFSDLIHSGDGYIATASNVNVPQEVEQYGLYGIFEEDVESYIKQINPLVLRDSKRSGQYLPKNCNVMNFGESKGLTADHVLIISTNPILNFLQGKENSFADKTGIGRNRAYVAITRARYSVAFVVKKNMTYLPAIVDWPLKD